MENNLLVYQDIAKRTDGDIYVGVVGPVRTGKSTFIKRFMDLLVIPNIDNSYKKERALDELPQSASGRTIMTTEPKFIPNEAVEITLGDNIKLRTRLVDCVGYLVNNAIGYLEDDMPRMIKTPWNDSEIPFELAAEIGTKKVIQEHSTIGILITSDGSICDIPREDYIAAEERCVKELKEINKPFVIVLNTANSQLDYTSTLAKKLEEKYNVPVIATDCSELSLDDINNIFFKVLYQFPIEQININFPNWVNNLPANHWLKNELYNEIKNSFDNINLIRQVNSSLSKLQKTEIIEYSKVEEITLGNGNINISINLKEDLFYKIVTEISEIKIDNEGDLFSAITSFAEIKKEYDKISYALNSVKTTGYGIVTPTMDELILEEPEMVKQGSRFGVKLKAKAPSIHIERIKQKCKISKKEKQSTYSNYLQRTTLYCYIKEKALLNPIKEITVFFILFIILFIKIICYYLFLKFLQNFQFAHHFHHISL